MESSQQAYFFGQRGTILSGEYPGWTVEFVDDTAETGGFLVFIQNPSPPSGAGECFDYWLEHKADIPGFIEESNWRIEWPGPDSAKI